MRLVNDDLGRALTLVEGVVRAWPTLPESVQRTILRHAVGPVDARAVSHADTPMRRWIEDFRTRLVSEGR